jgi:hypothetical protein
MGTTPNKCIDVGATLPPTAHAIHKDCMYSRK